LEFSTQSSVCKRMNYYLTNRNRMTLPFVNILGKYNRIISPH
jgi:hypothetical protein